MAQENYKFINIKYPFETDENRMLKLNQTSIKEIRSQIIFLLSTKKGTRIYKPEFGINLSKYLFEPLDDTTVSSIKQEMNDSVKRYMPNVNITTVDVKMGERTLNIKFEFNIKNGTSYFKESAEVNIV